MTISSLTSPRAAPRVAALFSAANPVAIAGVVEELRKRGPRTEILLDDDSGRIGVSFFDEQYQQFREILVKDALLLVEEQVALRRIRQYLGFARHQGQ